MNMVIVAFQVKHDPEQFEVAPPESWGRLQPIGAVIDEEGGVDLAFARAEGVDVGSRRGPAQTREALRTTGRALCAWGRPAQ